MTTPADKPKRKATRAKTTQRALRILEGHGWYPAVVEKWNPHARVTQDLYRFCDVLAVSCRGTVAVQVTSVDHHANRIKKLTTDPDVAYAVRRCLEADWLVEVWGLRPKNRPDKHGATLRATTLGLRGGEFVTVDYSTALTLET